MTNPLKPLEPRELLSNELDRRMRQNPRYSLRAFARDLDLAPSSLSEILRGRQGLSARKAQAVAERLGLNGTDQQYFIQLAESLFSKSSTRRHYAKNRVLQSLRSDGQKLIADEKFRVISDWYHFAILELFEKTNSQSNVQWVADQLGLETETAKDAINRLLSLELLVQDGSGNWKASDSSTHTFQDVPSMASRKFHQQVMIRGAEAVHEQGLEEREFGSTVLAIKQSDLPKLKQMIRQFREQFVSLVNQGEEKDRVYCLNLGLFGLDKNSTQSLGAQK